MTFRASTLKRWTGFRITKTKPLPPSLRAGYVIVHANARDAHLGGRGSSLGESIYTTGDPPVVVFNRLVTRLRMHRFYSMSAPTHSNDVAALTDTIRVERCGKETSLEAVMLPNQ